MFLLVLAMGVLLFGGLLSWMLGGRGGYGHAAGVLGCLSACGIGLFPSVSCLLKGTVETLWLPWAVPFGEFSLHLDALSALFLTVVFLVSGLGALYGSEYLRPGQARHSHWFFYNLLVAAMVLVLTAWNSLLFLIAWETMSLASFALVVTDDQKRSVRDAGWVYLVAMHLGVFFLFGLFSLMGHHAGSMNFNDFAAMPALSPGLAAALFLLSILGFGMKAGFVPMHVWLPEAHPAAPSHVSAVMSGVMIKTGIYGIFRMLAFFGPPPAWWGWALILIGLVSGVYGVLFALAQHDLKRLLAYHSVENIGIIALGMGIGLLGTSHGAPVVAFLGFGGALLHVINHAIFKGLLFLGAGSVLHAAGTADLERMGGLLKKMPRTGFCFLIGAAAITGLPPLNGFVSEYMIFMASFNGAVSGAPALCMPLIGTLAGLALISGLAAACFTKAFGVVFLGETRVTPAVFPKDPGARMGSAMMVLACACVLLGVFAPVSAGVVRPAVIAAGTPIPSSEITALAGLPWIMGAAAGVIVLAGMLALLRRRLLGGRTVTEGVTWDCGYAAPSATMQYTASSFAQPLTKLFGRILWTSSAGHGTAGFFPENASFETKTADVFHAYFYHPLFVLGARCFSWCRWLQHGSLHIYVLYIVITLLVLLVWKLG